MISDKAYKYMGKIFYSSVCGEGIGAKIVTVPAALKKEIGITGVALELVCGRCVDRKNVDYFFAAVYLIKALVGLNFVGTKALRLECRNIPIGRQCVSTALRHPSAYKYKSLYYVRLLRAILEAGNMVRSFERIVKNVEAIYVNDPSYLNGIYCEFAVIYNIPVYHMMYPYTLSRFDSDNVLNASDYFIVHPSNNFSYDRGYNKIKEIIEKTEKITYMSDIDFVNNEDLRDFVDGVDAIIYIHSFTDAQQLIEGDYDFLSVYDWLIFTLEKLDDKNIVLKVHPAFFRKGYVSKVSEWDKSIFNILRKKYLQRGNIKIVGVPIRNVDLLDMVPKSTVLISHHGTSLIEGGALGFKCICSAATPWRKYGLFNVWKDKVEYANLLDDFIAVNDTDQKKLYRYVDDLYESKGSYFSSVGSQMIISNELGVPAVELSRDPRLVSQMDENDLFKVVSLVCNNIEIIHVDNEVDL